MKEDLPKGHLHPITSVIREMVTIFDHMGFSVVQDRELEDEFHNFDALNMPKDHPARDMQDTFWLKSQTNADKMRTYADKMQNKIEKISEEESGQILMRTHTSNVQIRYMKTSLFIKVTWREEFSCVRT